MKALIAASGLLFMPQAFVAPLPPAEYQGNRPDFIHVLYADPITVDRTCKALMERGNASSQQVPADWIVYACTNTAARTTMLPDPCGEPYVSEAFGSLACHEKGHANGWGWEYPS